MIIVKLNVTKIPRERIFVGKKGKYLDLALVENKDGQDSYGNDGFVKIDLPREARDAGEKGEIVGNFKYVGGKPAAPKTPPPRQPQRPADPDLDAAGEDSDVPF